MFWLLFLISDVAADFKQPHYKCERTTMVQLFEWKWDDIADECETFLGPQGYGGVQISPPNENLVLWEYNRPWWERYQPMSYRLITRSGDEEQFANMVRRCNIVGVRIYADTILNHMTITYDENVGTGGSTADFATWSYPAVPYGYEDFHYPDCVIQPDDNVCCPDRVRNCQLYELKDLNQTKEYVRQKLVGYMNKLIDHGVAGFRLGDSKNMYPSDLKVIYSRVKELNVNHDFPTGAQPYIYQEVIELGGEAISKYEYADLAAVREFLCGVELSHVFNGTNPLKNLVTWGPEWGLLDSKTASTFIDNHDLQRGNLGPRFDVFTYKSPKQYKAVVAFMLAHPYGKPILMSSYAFTDPEAPPPMDKYGNIISRSINGDGSCGNGWVCEHRWRQIYQMVEFRNVARDTPIENWWDNGNNQIAFSRGDRAFIVFNLEACDLNLKLQTGLPPGTYCDIISGVRRRASCTGTKVIVRKDGTAYIRISSSAEDYHLAIHVGPQSYLENVYENWRADDGRLR